MVHFNCKWFFYPLNTSNWSDNVNCYIIKLTKSYDHLHQIEICTIFRTHVHVSVCPISWYLDRCSWHSIRWKGKWILSHSYIWCNLATNNHVNYLQINNTIQYCCFKITSNQIDVLISDVTHWTMLSYIFGVLRCSPLKWCMITVAPRY